MRHPGLLTSAAAALTVLLALPSLSAAQVRNRDGGDANNSGQAVPRGEARAPEPAPAAAPARAPAPQSANTAVRRTAPRTVETAETSSSPSAQRNQGARPRGDRPTVGTAVPRGSATRRQTIVVAQPVRYYRGYSPWAFGGVGFGFGFGSYSGSFYPYVFYAPYSPWYGGYGPYGYGYPPYGYGYPSVYTYPADGDLRLKITPRDAQVFVDGSVSTSPPDRIESRCALRDTRRSRLMSASRSVRPSRSKRICGESASCFSDGLNFAASTSRLEGRRR
jgi:hypothetical protein